MSKRLMLDQRVRSAYSSSTDTATAAIDGFRASESYGAAEIRKEIAEQTVAATRQALILDGVSAYYGVLRQAVSAGELADFEARIPQDVARLLKSM